MTETRVHWQHRARASGTRHKVVLYNPQAVFFTMPLALLTIGSHLDPERYEVIIGFPEESDESVQATIDVAKRLRAMSPKFQTPIFYFKPYPGTSITQEAVKDGFILPSSLDAWSEFDFVGSIGPWVSPQKYQLIEAFKFYQAKAWEQDTAWQRVLQKLAQWRLRNDIYGLPVEKIVSHWLKPQQVLS